MWIINENLKPLNGASKRFPIWVGALEHLEHLMCARVHSVVHSQVHDTFDPVYTAANTGSLRTPVRKYGHPTILAMDQTRRVDSSLRTWVISPNSPPLHVSLSGWFVRD